MGRVTREPISVRLAVARSTPLFQGNAVQAYFTFFDLAKMLGFEIITVSDGREFAHRIALE